MNDQTVKDKYATDWLFGDSKFTLTSNLRALLDQRSSIINSNLGIAC